MKLAIVRQKFPADGGAENHVLRISQLLASKGIDVRVFTSDIDMKWNRVRSGLEAFDGFSVRRHRAAGRVFRNLIIPSLLPSLITSDADIIHAHGHFYNSTELSFLAAKLSGKHLVLTPHLQPYHAYPEGLERNLRKAYERLLDKPLFTRADKIIAVSPYSEHYLKTRLGVEAEKIVMIPNGLDHSRFDSNGRPEVFRRKWSIPDELILYVGHISARKGLPYLVEALPKVVADYPNAKLVLVGVDRGWLQPLKAIARRAGVEESIVFTGYLAEPELSAAYNAADLFVLPSMHEAFGLVLLEAMGSGLPVVATRAGGIPYVVEDGKEGLLVPPANSCELAEAMLRVLADRGLAAVLRSNGIRKAQSWPSWNEVVNRTLAVYQSLN